jgi:Flp pilus assembly protein TadG
MHQGQKKHTNRRGAAAVEFALCAPILFAFIFGIFEFSRVTQLQQSARLAAFEGARAGIALDAATTDVQTAVNQVMSANGIANYTTTITPNPMGYTSPTITVTVMLSPSRNGWAIWYVSSASTITATVTLEREIQAVSVP